MMEPVMPMPIKRKLSSDGSEMISFFENDSDDEDVSSNDRYTSEEDSKRMNHSVIEKRRREKMNTYIQELSAMVPTCSAMKAKLDKLTILRMAVQHMKTLRGATSSCKEANYKPSFLPDHELRNLIMAAADGFLFVVSCDRGKLLYVSEPVINILNVSREHLIGQSLFDVLHPKDVAKVKEQLSSSNLAPRERLIDAKTGLPLKSEATPSPPQLSSGARRAFFCRMKTYSKQSFVKTEGVHPCSKKRLKQTSELRRYINIHCTGYMKSWPPAKIGISGGGEDGESDGCNLSCLVAIARVLSMATARDANENIPVKPTTYESRHAMDGKFTFIDQRVTTILGYLPQELSGTSVYEYFHIDDIPQMADKHKEVLATDNKVLSKPYRFRAKNGEFVELKSTMFCFRNPWTKDVEYIVSNNTVISSKDPPAASCSSSSEAGMTQLDSMLKQGMTKRAATIPGVPKNSWVGAGKIGRLIAEEVMEREKVDSPPNSNESSGNNSPSCSSNAQPAPLSVETSSMFLQDSPSESALTTDASNSSYAGFGNEDAAIVQSPDQSTSDILASAGLAAESVQAVKKALASGEKPASDDEEAMAFIMSLLEADAGLGGAVDFTDLPWPL
ncbi:basic helix-loop-helix ARNT-like protein 1 isoform X2 [Amphiura filiformis]|uniref:basic helix-loop-helix ARNT-like protein 1 isoform X2 n=1 Tax=Amphiura filiformis TaxID=82378 RepID=UPI003B21550D